MQANGLAFTANVPDDRTKGGGRRSTNVRLAPQIQNDGNAELHDISICGRHQRTKDRSKGTSEKQHRLIYQIQYLRYDGTAVVQSNDDISITFAFQCPLLASSLGQPPDVSAGPAPPNTHSRAPDPYTRKVSGGVAFSGSTRSLIIRPVTQTVVSAQIAIKEHCHVIFGESRAILTRSLG